jgi:hypothetical protein
MKFKDGTVSVRFHDLHPRLQEIAKDLDAWAQDQFDMEITLTCAVSLPAEDKASGRVHRGHQERRCMDVRVNDWPAYWAHQFRDHFNEKYKEIGAISASSGERTFIVIHGEGNNIHAHCQLNRSFALPPLEEKS